MTKSQLIEKLAFSARIRKTQAGAVVNGVFESLAEALKRGEKVEVRGFGSFSVRSYGSYTGRNPKTNEKLRIPPKRLAFFRVGKDMKEVVGRAPSPRGERT